MALNCCVICQIKQKAPISAAQLSSQVTWFLAAPWIIDGSSVLLATTSAQ
jgi:hypothetical protein